MEQDIKHSMHQAPNTASLLEIRARLRNKLMNTKDMPLYSKTEANGGSGLNVAAIDEKTSEPASSKIEVRVDHDKMTASIKVFPPENGGADISLEMLELALTANHIVDGIDRDQLKDIVLKKRYMENIKIAAGTPPIKGQDWEVIDCFEREKVLKFAENENGIIDFKTLNIINAVEPGTVLCNIMEPVPATAGIDIYGAIVPGRDGKAVYIPQGINTVLSSDGRQLLAAECGNLVFRNNKFTIDKIYEVRGNVDNSIGNIDFPGDVMILGDVFEGYSIKAKGNVTVYGRVEGASIFSQGHILLKSGMNGMNKGELAAKGDITSNYLENCKIKAQGNINVESIINSTVFCNGNLTASGKRGAIIGGICTVQKMFEAKSIGSRTDILTTIVLGATAELISERNALHDGLSELEKNLENLSLNINYLEAGNRSEALSQERQKKLEGMKREKPINMLKQAQLKKRLQEINEQVNNTESSRLKSLEIFPHTKISIGNATMITQTLYNKCMMYYSEGEIKVTSY